MDFGIAGRTAVVTGASRGIGLATAAALAAEGVSLVLSARGAEGLEKAADELRDTGANVVAVPGDVCEPSTTDAILRAAEQSFGGVDILVNNAGGESGHAPIERLTDEDWEQSYRINVVSAVRLSVAVARRMREQRWGRIVNISSTMARIPQPFCAPYAASKAALLNATRNLSRQYAAHGICANCVLPGLTDTEGVRDTFGEAVAATGRSREELVALMLERTPIDAGRLGTSEEVAAAVAFLCSEPARWITGACLSVDGGTIRTAP